MAQSYDRSWLHSVNNSRTPATALESTQYSCWTLCSALIGGTFGGFGASAGKWTLIGTSNGVAASLDGTDRLNLNGAFTAGDWVRAAAGVAHSWAVLRSPVMSTGMQFYMLVSLGTAADTTIVLLFSKAAFTGGSVTADPTATDSWNTINSASIVITSALSQMYWNVHLSATGDWIWNNVRPAGVSIGSNTHYAMFCVAPIDPDPADLYPLVTYTNLQYDTNNMAGLTVNTTKTAGGNAAFWGTPVNSGNWLVNGSSATGDVLTGAVPDLPLWVVVNTTSQGWHARGRCPDIMLSGRNGGGFYPHYGKTIRDGGTIRYQTVSGLVLPTDTLYLYA